MSDSGAGVGRPGPGQGPPATPAAAKRAKRSTKAGDQILLATQDGKSIRFNEDQVRAMGRAATGVRGISTREGDATVGMEVLKPGKTILTVSENGYGKRTPITEYTRHGRGTKGMIAIQQSERNGRVVAATLVRPDDEIMLITDRGVMVRTRVAEISMPWRSATARKLS